MPQGTAPRARLSAASAHGIVLVLVLACRGEGDEARRAEAGRLSHAVKLLRDAPNAGKRPLLKALEQATCTTPDVCALKKACVEAYAVELSALDAVGAVRREASGSTHAITAGASELLLRAEADLRRSKELAKQCADLEGEAQRNYRL